MSNIELAENIGHSSGIADAREILTDRAKLKLAEGEPYIALALTEAAKDLGKLIKPNKFD